MSLFGSSAASLYGEAASIDDLLPSYSAPSLGLSIKNSNSGGVAELDDINQPMDSEEDPLNVKEPRSSPEMSMEAPHIRPSRPTIDVGLIEESLERINARIDALELRLESLANARKFHLPSILKRTWNFLFETVLHSKPTVIRKANDSLNFRF